MFLAWLPLVSFKKQLVNVPGIPTPGVIKNNLLMFLAYQPLVSLKTLVNVPGIATHGVNKKLLNVPGIIKNKQTCECSCHGNPWCH